jgi:hypothetical protein
MHNVRESTFIAKRLCGTTITRHSLRHEVKVLLPEDPIKSFVHSKAPLYDLNVHLLLDIKCSVGRTPDRRTAGLRDPSGINFNCQYDGPCRVFWSIMRPKDNDRSGFSVRTVLWLRGKVVSPCFRET